MNKDLLTMEDLPAKDDVTKGALYRDAKLLNGTSSVYVYSARFALKEQDHYGVNLFWRGGFYMAVLRDQTGGYRVVRIEKTERKLVDKRAWEDAENKNRQAKVTGKRLLVDSMTASVTADDEPHNYGHSPH